MICFHAGVAAEHPAAVAASAIRRDGKVKRAAPSAADQATAACRSTSGDCDAGDGNVAGDGNDAGDGNGAGDGNDGNTVADGVGDKFKLHQLQLVAQPLVMVYWCALVFLVMKMLMDDGTMDLLPKNGF